ncbi:RAD protein (Pv-fam-e) [Plasmodium ovale curtisi]|uniref:RAD protein (Pv-fam-e) n=1 Tax=Plasmodium ovale curtisi TaxID=864141 RepID=A0A1A8VKY3_PLAOA|nr:RAD protein (Pv-fam-e) [Plasmodium ovale curtisi]SBS82787.1 RAD protein (Pv-fam-e) [Plasmodium ovale curtisi]
MAEKRTHGDSSPDCFYVSKTTTRSNLQLSSGKCMRRLAESSINVRENLPKSKLNGNQSSELPFGCKESDLSRELTMDEINKLISSCIFFVNKKKAYIVFYHYNNYLMRTYCNMMNKLSNTFIELASKHGIPEEVREKHWKECNEALTYDLMYMNDSAMKYFYFFVKERMFYLKFREFLIRCKEHWIATIQRNEQKWSKFLYDLVINYKSIEGKGDIPKGSISTGASSNRHQCNERKKYKRKVVESKYTAKRNNNQKNEQKKTF